MSLSSSSLYGARLQSTSAKNWNQGVAAVLSAPLARRWRVAVNGDAGVVNFDESLFAASTLGNIAATDASFADLSSAMLDGKGTDPVLANAGGFQQDSTAGRFLVGRRIGSVGGGGALSYSRSARLIFSVTAGASQIRQLNDGTQPPDFVYARVASGGLGTQVSYSLSPRTQIGFNANVSRAFSETLHNTGAAGSFSFSRIGRRWWFADASVGAGTNLTGGQSHQTITYSGSLGIRTRNHTFLGAYARGIGDPFLLALGTPWYSDATTLAWHWKKPLATWWFSSMFSDLHAITTGLPTTNSWTMLEIFGQQLGPHYSVSGEYSFGRLGARRYIQDGKRYQLQQRGMRVSFTWYPSAKRIPRRSR
jgi:hypothetical protein